MLNSKELFAKAVDLYDKVEALNNKDGVTVEEVQAALSEAKAVEQRATIAKEAEEAKAAMEQPVMPASLPSGDEGGEGDGNDEDGDRKAFNAAYVLRYNDSEEQEVKAILSDVYGNEDNYRNLRVEKGAHFNSYLRTGRGKDDAMSREFVMTPQDAARLMREGKSVADFKSTMVESVGNLGGYVAPGDFSSNIIQRLPGLTVARGLATKEQTSSNSMTLAKDKGGDDQYTSNVRESFVNETPASGASETNLLWSMEDVPVHTAMGSVPLSKNLLEDAAFDLTSHLIRKFAEAAAINEDNTFLTGNGVGKPEGILPGGANSNSLTEVVTGAGAALTFDGLIAMTFGIASQYLTNAVWIARRSTYQAIAQLRDESGGSDTGQYLWRDQYGNNVSGPQRQLLGYPVYQQESLPAVAANTYPILFGDLSGYTILDRIGMTVERYDDATTAKANTVEYVMRRRFGGQLLEPYRLCVQKVAAS